MLVTDPNVLGILISFYEAHLLQGFFSLYSLAVLCLYVMFLSHPHLSYPPSSLRRTLKPILCPTHLYRTLRSFVCVTQ